MGILLFDLSSPLTVANGISGSGYVQQMGTGTITLTGTNKYTGLTTINAGSTLQVGENNALPTGTALTDYGTLNLAGYMQQVASVTGPGTVTDTGASDRAVVQRAHAGRDRRPGRVRVVGAGPGRRSPRQGFSDNRSG